jgi:hypothetical protein
MHTNFLINPIPLPPPGSKLHSFSYTSTTSTTSTTTLVLLSFSCSRRRLPTLLLLDPPPLLLLLLLLLVDTHLRPQRLRVSVEEEDDHVVFVVATDAFRLALLALDSRRPALVRWRRYQAECLTRKGSSHGSVKWEPSSPGRSMGRLMMIGAAAIFV